MSGIFLLYGYQGAGKGTIGQSLRQKEYDHISTGDVMRELERSSDDLSLTEREWIKTGQAGLSKELVQLLTKKVFERTKMAIDQGCGVVLDGFPKTIEQCEQLEHFLNENRLKERLQVVLLDISPDEAVERVLSRINCEKCNWVYNSRSYRPEIPGKCDRCAGKLILRPSDTIDNTCKRHQGFEKMMHEEIRPYYGDRLKTLKVDCSINVMLERFDYEFKV